MFLNAQYSAYIFAKAMGYDELKSPTIYWWRPKNFLNTIILMTVIHYRLQRACGFGSMGRDADQIIKDYRT